LDFERSAANGSRTAAHAAERGIMSIVVLIGNGLSSGFDPRLTTNALTERVLERLGPDYAARSERACVDELERAGYSTDAIIEARPKVGELYIEIVAGTGLPESLWELKSEPRSRSWSTCDECGKPAVHDADSRFVSRCAAQADEMSHG
jgi:hypothetical protein